MPQPPITRWHRSLSSYHTSVRSPQLGLFTVDFLEEATAFMRVVGSRNAGGLAKPAWHLDFSGSARHIPARAFRSRSKIATQSSSRGQFHIAISEYLHQIMKDVTTPNVKMQGGPGENRVSPSTLPAGGGHQRRSWCFKQKRKKMNPESRRRMYRAKPARAEGRVTRSFAQSPRDITQTCAAGRWVTELPSNLMKNVTSRYQS